MKLLKQRGVRNQRTLRIDCAVEALDAAAQLQFDRDAIDRLAAEAANIRDALESDAETDAGTEVNCCGR
ncbi:MAG: hypothetical protein KY410_07295 [Proteobacteria bacterium]|nr:hypothetical protein [Pseudomonadota bacterium]